MTRLLRKIRNHGARRSGVTLIELLIVILIMLMITAVTVPAISPALEGRKVREAARIVEVFLNGARNRAIASGHSVGVLIEPDENEPSQCIALSYVEQPDPYAGDYSNSKLITLGNGGFGAWSITPHNDATPAFVPGVVSADPIFPQGDVGWMQNLSPGDLFILGNDDTVQYRLYAGEPYMDLNNDGQYTPSIPEPFNDVDGDGAYTVPVAVTPGGVQVIDPITGFFAGIPPIIWGTTSAFVTYTYADPIMAAKYMSPNGSYYVPNLVPPFPPYYLPTKLPLYLDLAQTSPATPFYVSPKSSIEPGSGTPTNQHSFQFFRRPIETSSATVNLPDSTCIDLGSTLIDPATGNLIAAPGSGLDMIVPSSSGSSTLGSYATFRPNPLTDHEINPAASATTVVNRPLMITFDASGIVDRVYSYDERHFIQNNSALSLGQSINSTDYQGRLATSPIYLLIGKRELIDGDVELLAKFQAGVAPLKPVFNMQDPAALWVAINPRTGLISSAENVAPDLTKVPPTTQTPASPQVQLYFNVQAYQARTLAREALDMGGM